jgi:hypothetical protein
MALVVLNEAPMRPAAKMPLIGLPKVRGPKGRSLTLNQDRPRVSLGWLDARVSLGYRSGGLM